MYDGVYNNIDTVMLNMVKHVVLCNTERRTNQLHNIYINTIPGSYSGDIYYVYHGLCWREMTGTAHSRVGGVSVGKSGWSVTERGTSNAAERYGGRT